MRLGLVKIYQLPREGGGESVKVSIQKRSDKESKQENVKVKGFSFREWIYRGLGNQIH